MFVKTSLLLLIYSASNIYIRWKSFSNTLSIAYPTFSQRQKNEEPQSFTVINNNSSFCFIPGHYYSYDLLIDQQLHHTASYTSYNRLYNNTHPNSLSPASIIAIQFTKKVHTMFQQSLSWISPQWEEAEGWIFNLHLLFKLRRVWGLWK